MFGMKKCVLITGASKGIGLALSKLFLENNYKVIGTCRSGRVDQISHPDFTAIELDVTCFESIERAATVLLKEHRIDILINNAGVGLDLNTSTPDKESFKQTFDVNVSGTVFFTEAVIDILKKQAKIVNVSSHMGSVDGCKSSDSVAYRMSKSALNMYTKILSNRLKGKATIASIHPGWVRTTITEGNVAMASLSPETSARNIYEFITSEFETGIFWNTTTQSRLDW